MMATPMSVHSLITRSSAQLNPPDAGFRSLSSVWMISREVGEAATKDDRAVHCSTIVCIYALVQGRSSRAPTRSSTPWALEAWERYTAPAIRASVAKSPSKFYLLISPPTPDALARFEREAGIVATLSHPNIVVLYDIGSDHDVSYAVTELLEGETLRSRLHRGPVPQPEAAEIGAAIAEGLAAVHSRGIVHRDLKPENIFLTSAGRIKILDFGLAQPPAINPPGAPDVTRTEPGVLMGTVGYMSPEQVQGKQLDSASDIFSLGCVLYEMLSGRRAFSCTLPC